MKQTFFLLFILFTFSFSSTAKANETTIYASAITDVSVNVLNSSYATGTPDNLFADFRDADASITLDFGTELTNDSTITYRIFDYGATARIEFLDASNETVQTTTEQLDLESDTLLISYTAESAYRFLKITEVEEETWSVDAVGIITTTAEETTSASAEPPTIEDTAGMLVKLENSNTVYELGSDDKRHAFPNQVIFESWYDPSSIEITTIDAVTMASYKLGSNVTMRPGTWLVKITTDPKVYAVEPGGVLRWVTTEAIAESLLGDSWNTKVADVADVFWHNYTFGDDITSAVYPDGTIVVSSGGSSLNDADAGFWYIENGNRFFISDATRFSANFYLPLLFTLNIDDSDLDLYVDAGDLADVESIQSPF